MTDFMIRFFLCNIWLCGIVGILLLARRLFQSCLSCRMQYHLWFLLLGLLAVPFLPLKPVLLNPSRFFFWSNGLKRSFRAAGKIRTSIGSGRSLASASHWLNDFTLSVSSKASPSIGWVLFGIWSLGMLVMILFLVKSAFRLHRIRQSSLPLQNQNVCKVYQLCLQEMGITGNLPVYTTAFLSSPVIVGLFRPCIYLPLPLLAGSDQSGLRYMLLHELQHYRHKDTLVNALMNLARILYWFHPLIWYALKEMRNDRELACDTSVLNMLDADAYIEYGSTLIRFAETLSRSPGPFTAGIGGSKKQIHRRILNIAAYQKPTLEKRLKGMAAFALTGLLLSCLAPILSTYAAESDRYQWDISSRQTVFPDLSAYFGTYDGTFVLYDEKQDTWYIHNPEHALLRFSPDSTYKIYDALFALEEGIITPEHSRMAWDGKRWPYEAWNADQTLQTAMSGSVTWYFQEIDQRLGMASADWYLHKIGYGNENTSGGSSYWLESSLKISAVEQTELLSKLYHNRFGFAPENIRSVKDSLFLSSSECGSFYGKTGTGRVDGQNVNGWFVGYVETSDNLYFFATNITGDQDTAGSQAAEITMSILDTMNLR